MYFGSFWAPTGDWMDTKLPYVTLLGFMAYLDWILSFVLHFYSLYVKNSPVLFFYWGQEMKRKNIHDRTFMGFKGNCKNKLLRIRQKLLSLSLTLSLSPSLILYHDVKIDDVRTTCKSFVIWLCVLRCFGFFFPYSRLLVGNYVSWSEYI